MPASVAPTVTVEEGVTVVALGPEFENLDEYLLDQVRQQILDYAQSATPPLVVIDLTCVHFFGSSFIEILFRISKRLKERDGRFAVCGLTPYCLEVIQITHLDTLWPIFPDRASAVKAVRAAAQQAG